MLTFKLNSRLILDFIKSKNLSRNQFSIISNVGFSTLQNVLSNPNRFVKQVTLDNIANVLNVEPQALILDTKKSKPPCADSKLARRCV